jgi:C_GCAxxG_C_C family probable redox protein
MRNRKINISAIKEEAEQLYRDGDYYCSEAIIATIRKHFDPNMPEEAIAMGSGFPVGIGGSMCICGAVSGGVLALGYFFGRVKPKDTKVKKAMELSKELHDFFQGKNKVLCCKVLCRGMELGSDEHKKQCVAFTGEVAVKTAELIARELHPEFPGIIEFT